jgi:hypothetical protein
MVVIIGTFAIATLRFLEASAEKGEQLIRRSKAELAPRINLFNPPFELSSRWLRLRPKLEYECPTHHEITIREPARRAVKVACNFP